MLVHRLEMNLDGIEDKGEACACLDAEIHAVVVFREGICIFLFNIVAETLDGKPVSSVKSGIDQDLHFPEIYVAMCQERHFDHIHPCRTLSGSGQSRYIVLLVLGLQPECLLGVENSYLEAEIRHKIEHFAVAAVHYAEVPGHKDHFLGHRRIPQHLA